MQIFVGGKYVGRSGFSVRTITELRGDDVFWEDRISDGRCSVGTFKKWAVSMPSDRPRPPTDQPQPKRVGPKLRSEMSQEFLLIEDALKAALAFCSEQANADRQFSVGLGISAVSMAFAMMRDAMDDASKPDCRLIRVATDMDRAATHLQGSISALLDVLNEAQDSLSADERQLGESLAYGSLQTAQFQFVLAPFLDR